jgi:hypothetical protein
VIIGCEKSGVVRRAFRALGHEAFSCDIEPSEDGSPFHFQCDIRDIPKGAWHLGIFHPPCTYLTLAGARWLYQNGRGKIRDQQRWFDMEAAAMFFNELLSLDIPRICIENPVMHGHAKERILSPYNQIVQPYFFGHPETKKTCLWLKGLPPLVATKMIPPDFVRWPKGRGNGYEPKCHYESPGADRAANRSRTVVGLGEAMAEQWGTYGDPGAGE